MNRLCHAPQADCFVDETLRHSLHGVMRKDQFPSLRKRRLRAGFEVTLPSQRMDIVGPAKFVKNVLENGNE